MKRVFRWVGLGLLSIVGIVLLVAAVQIVRFNRAANRDYGVEPPAIEATTDSAVIARGRHIAESYGGCTGCHGADLSGTPPESFGPIGVMSPPNLTRGAGGTGSLYTDRELARAIRHGIRHDGTALLIMPSQEFNWWPDSDLRAVVSYVRSMPPVDAEREPTRVSLLGRILAEFGMLDALAASTLDHDAPREAVPSPEATARYGEYLVRGCKGCHGDGLSGGRIPGTPATIPEPANLTPHETGLASWTREDFHRLLNTGVRPDGTEVDPFMSTEGTRRLTETEKDAIWAYLRTLPPRERGGR